MLFRLNLLCFGWWIKYSIIETFFIHPDPELLKETREIASKSERKEREGGEMFKRMRKTIPGIYSTCITPSHLGVGFRKEVEGVRGGRQRIRMRSGGGKEKGSGERLH